MISWSACQTVAGVSAEYQGSSGATLSPHPTMPLASARAMTRVWCVSTEPLVSYGDRSGSRTLATPGSLARDFREVA